MQSLPTHFFFSTFLSFSRCGARSSYLWVHGNIFWQLSRVGNLHCSGMSHATKASPKPSFRAPWRVGDALVGRGNAGWTTSKCGHPCPCQNCSQGPPAEEIGRGSLLNRLDPHVHPPPPPTTQLVKGVKRTEFIIVLFITCCLLL